MCFLTHPLMMFGPDPHYPYQVGCGVSACFRVVRALQKSGSWTHQVRDATNNAVSDSEPTPLLRSKFV